MRQQKEDAMYGTVARMRIKPGMEGRLQEMMREYGGPGLRGQYGLLDG